jgi:hypothetical protein
MAHIKFNHFNSSAFNSFVPEAAKVANRQFMTNLLIIGGIAFIAWLVFKPRPVLVKKGEENKE